MSRRGRLDAVIAGGGVVGAAAALMLARQGWQVALVEPRQPPAWQRDVPDLRVFAFAPDNSSSSIFSNAPNRRDSCFSLRRSASTIGPSLPGTLAPPAPLTCRALWAFGEQPQERRMMR